MFIFNYLKQSIQSTALEESQLKKIGADSLPPLLEASNSTERTGHLRKIGQEVLKRGSHWKRVNWRQFALMHNSSIIRETSFEGGEIADSCDAWKEHIQQTRSKEGRFFSFSLKEKAMDDLKVVLEDVSFFRSFLPGAKEKPLEQNHVIHLAKAMQKALHDRLNSRKSAVYLPMGYRNGVGNEGHAIPFKVNWENNLIVISPLNSGNGSEEHPVLDYTSTQEKDSFRYFPIKIHAVDFWGEVGLLAFCHLIRYMADPPEPDHIPYEGSDLYDILHVWGRLVPDLGAHPEVYAAKRQRGGTCPEKGIKNIVHDALIDINTPFLDVKLFFLNIYFCSLIAGYHTYLDNPGEKARVLLKNGAEEFGIALQKWKAELSEEEYLAAFACVLEIKEATKKGNVKPADKADESKADLPPITSFSEQFPKVQNHEIERLKKMEIQADISLSEKPAVRAEKPHFDMTKCLEILKEWASILRNLPEGKKSFAFLWECTLCMPIPEWNKEDAWDQIDKEKISDILILFEELAYLGLRKKKDSYSDKGEFSFFREFLALHTIYSAADKLARRLAYTKLEGFASPFILHVYDCHPNDFTFLPFGLENQRYSQISLYFEKSKKEAQNKVIFPVEPTLSIQEYERQSLRGDRSQGACHIMFLRHFVYRLFPNASSAVLTPYHLYFWKDLKRALPREIYSLYYFAFLASLHFFGSEEGFPSELNFEETTDSNGLKAVKIETRGKKLFIDHPTNRKNKEARHQNAYDQLHGLDSAQAGEDFFNKVFTPLTTNEAVCTRLSEEDASRFKISEPVFRDLLRVTRKNNLKVPLALSWASSNLAYLEHKGIQLILSHCFFAPGMLLERLREEPGLIYSLRRFIQDGLEYYRDNLYHLDGILFLIRCGIFFETHASLLLGKEESGKALLEYKSRLELLLKKDLKSNEDLAAITFHWICCECERDGISGEDLIALIVKVAQFLQSDQKIDAPFLMRTKFLTYVQELGWRVQGKATNATFRNALCNALFKAFLPDLFLALKERAWEGSFPIAACQDYEIDLLKFTIRHREKGELTFLTLSNLRTSYKNLEEKHDKRFWVRPVKTEREKGFEYTSLDGKISVNTLCGDSLVEKKILFEGKERWGRIFHFNTQQIDKENLDFLNYEELLPIKTYILVEKEGSEPDIVALYSENDEPFFRMDYQERGLVVTRLDKWGFTLPIRMANLSDIKDKKHPLYAYTLNYAHSSCVLCFVNTKTKEVEELYFIYFKLQFKKTALGLESVQFPGFTLQVGQPLEALDYFSGAFVLKNKEGDCKVLLPYAKLRPSMEDFSQDIELTREYFHASSKRYAVFDLDPFTGELKSHDSNANLYAAYLFKLKRKIDKALFYLKQAKKAALLTYDEMKFIINFTTIRDRSPASLAFNMRLLYFVVNNLNIMREDRFKERSNYYFIEFFAWGHDAYLDYLKAISQETLSAIPKALRLDLEEERAILRELKQLSEGRGQKKLPQLLELRYVLLCRGKNKASAMIQPKEVRLRPAAYKNVLPIKDVKWIGPLDEKAPFPYGENRRKNIPEWVNTNFFFCANRITGQAVEIYFPQLFEQAKQSRKNGVDAFDFVLLALLKVDKRHQSEDIGFKLANILFYVRHFSHRFEDLSFHHADEKKNVAVFNKILERLYDLENTQEYRRFGECFLEETSVFSFERKSVLTMPLQKEEASVMLQKTQKIGFPPFPFLDIRRALFKKEESVQKISEAPPFIDETLAPEPDTLEAELIDKYKEGYEKLKQRKTVQYHFQERMIKEGRKQLAQKKNQLQGKIKEKREELLKRANVSYTLRQGKLSKEELVKETDARLQKETKQSLRLTPEILMKEAILKGDPSFLERNSPLLDKKEVQAILEGVCEYYYLLTLNRMCEEALELLERLEENPKNASDCEKLAFLLDYEFSFDPKDYPEIFYFKVLEGKLPRKEQLEIYLWVCEGLEKKENRLFQHKAGGGKTDYLTPLFMLRAKREKLMPVFLSTQMMYSVDRHNLAFTLAKFNEEIYLLEVGLHMKLSDQELKFIYNQLNQYYKQGKGLIITSQTYYALKLQYRHAAIKEEDLEKVRWLGLILNFFETKCLLLEDEAHRNSDPLTRAIFGVGEFFPLPKKENELFLNLMKPLLGFEQVFCPDGRLLSEVSRLEKNLVGTPALSDIKAVQQTLARYIAASKLLDIPEKHKEELAAYWSDVKAEEPEYLKNLAASDRAKACLMALTGYFILELLPQMIKMRTELDHGPSIYPEEEFDTPYHLKTPSTAQFEDPYLSSALSTKGTGHRFLSERQVRKLLEKLITQDQKEQMGSVFEENASELFAGWVKGTPLASYHLRDIALSNTKQMQEIVAVLAKKTCVIEYYLTHFILSQIGYSLEQLSVTPAHLVGGFARAILFSATPGLLHTYPRSIKAVRYDPVFEAEVSTEYAKEKNSRTVFVEDQESVFAEIKKGESLLAQATVLLDPAGFYCDHDYSGQTVAKKWLLSSDLDGVFYFKEGKSLSVNKDEKICLLLRKNMETPIEIEGSNIAEALREYGLDWHKLKLGTYYDASHTESANIMQKEGAVGAIFMGENITSSRLAQALMRLRGFLDAYQDQSIIWVYPASLSKKIPTGKHKELKASAAFSWTVKNEAMQQKKKAILTAFQEIQYECESCVEEELQGALTSPEKQIEILKRHAEGLLERKEHDPYRDFASHEQEADSRDVLWQYAHSIYKKFGFEIELEENKELYSKIRGVIEALQTRIQKIEIHAARKLSTEVIRHSQIKKETEQMHYRPRPFDPLSAEGIFGDIKIFQPNFYKMMWKKESQEVFQSKKISKFFLEINQIITAKNAGKSMEENYLKPIDFFLIILSENEPPLAIVMNNDIVTTTVKDLIEGTDNPQIKHTLFLITADGKIVQRGKKRLAPQEGEVKKIMQSEWLEDLLIDAALLKGQIRNPERLFERMLDWENFEQFWKKVVEAQPNPESVNQGTMTKLLAKLKEKQLKKT